MAKDDLLDWHRDRGCNTRCREGVHADVWEQVWYGPKGTIDWEPSQCYALKHGYILTVIGPAESPCVHPEGHLFGAGAECERFLVELTADKAT